MPTAADMAQMRAMGAEERWAHWKEHHGQHCWAMHFEAGGCQRVRRGDLERQPSLHKNASRRHAPRPWTAAYHAYYCYYYSLPQARTCAFVHADVAEPSSVNDPSWLQEKAGL